MASERKTTFINIIMNRGSFGDSDHTQVVLRGESGGLPAEVPVKRVTVDEQKVSREISGTLEVDIVKEFPDFDLAEVEIRPGETHQLRIDKKSHLIKPIRMVPEYYELGEYVPEHHQ